MVEDADDLLYLNDLILSTMRETDLRNKNYVIISSEVDEYENCKVLDDYLGGANSYARISSVSKCVMTHNQITRYELPYIKAFLLFNSQGSHPYFPSFLIKNGGEGSLEVAEKQLKYLRSKKELVACITKVKIEKEIFFVEGYAFIKGYDSSGYGLWKKELILRDVNSGKETAITIGSTRNKQLSMDFYDEVFCNYLTGGFATLSYKGIYLDHISGKFELFIKVSNSQIEIKNRLRCSKEFQITSDKLIFTGNKESSFISVKSNNTNSAENLLF